MEDIVKKIIEEGEQIVYEQRLALICNAVINKINILNKRVNKMINDYEGLYYLKDKSGKNAVTEKDVAKLANRMFTQVKEMNQDLDNFLVSMNKLKERVKQ
jgi:predicted transcriptional regulator